MSIQCSRPTVPRGTHLAALKRRSPDSTFSLYYPYLTAYIWWTCLFMATHSTRVWMSSTIEGMWEWKPLFCHCKCIKALQYLRLICSL